jgi:hypothetical protein
MIQIPILLLVALAGSGGSNPPSPAASKTIPMGAVAPVVSHTPPMVFVSFTDPKEKAFTVEVPKGWSARGGLFRFAAVDTRPALELTSPDGGIRITSGDAEIPTFTLPSQTLAFAGFTEGSWYSPGYGVRMMVQRYLPGAPFAEQYVRDRVLTATDCREGTIVNRRDRTDLSRAVNELYQSQAPPGGVARLDVGEVRFECLRNGQRWRGYYLAGTLLLGTQQGGIWHVDHLIGYAATPAQAPLAEAIALHMIRSARINPEWARMQEGLAANVSQIVAETNSALSDGIRKTFESRWSREAEAMRKDANMRRETTDLIDPDTGETWNVRSQSRYFWRKPGSDLVVGTETFEVPGVGFQQLVPY